VAPTSGPQAGFGDEDGGLFTLRDVARQRLGHISLAGGDGVLSGRCRFEELLQLLDEPDGRVVRPPPVLLVVDDAEVSPFWILVALEKTGRPEDVRRDRGVVGGEDRTHRDWLAFEGDLSGDREKPALEDGVLGLQARFTKAGELPFEPIGVALEPRGRRLVRPTRHGRAPPAAASSSQAPGKAAA
jgi:hypothetical protein